MNAITINLKGMTHYYSAAGDRFFVIFKMEQCENCGEEIAACNSIQLIQDENSRELVKKFKEVNHRPSEGWYDSDLDCEVCENCAP